LKTLFLIFNHTLTSIQDEDERVVAVLNRFPTIYNYYTFQMCAFLHTSKNIPKVLVSFKKEEYMPCTQISTPALILFYGLKFISEECNLL
jgi:hypothetical protein